jgi:CRP-like cAMP-binding protein
MTNAALAAKLRRTVLFEDFTEEELARCVELLDPVTASAGEIVVHQDDLGDCMYIVVAGHCRVVHHSEGRDITLATLKDGDFFGELALVDEGARSADVEAMTDVTLLKLTQAAIGAIAGVFPSAAIKLLIAIGRIMVSRLRNTNRRYVDSLLFPLQGVD